MVYTSTVPVPGSNFAIPPHITFTESYISDIINIIITLLLFSVVRNYFFDEASSPKAEDRRSLHVVG